MPSSIRSKTSCAGIVPTGRTGRRRSAGDGLLLRPVPGGYPTRPALAEREGIPPATCSRDKSGSGAHIRRSGYQVGLALAADMEDDIGGRQGIGPDDGIAPQFRECPPLMVVADYRAHRAPEPITLPNPTHDFSMAADYDSADGTESGGLTVGAPVCVAEPVVPIAKLPESTGTTASLEPP